MGGKTREYDLIVIGGGPAGITGAITASVHGKTVAVVESRNELGGAGMNTGTVPSKTLRETALASRRCDRVTSTVWTCPSGGRQP